MPASAHQEQGGTVIFWVLPAGRLMGHALTLHRVLTENKGTGSLKNRPKTPSHQPKRGSLKSCLSPRPRPARFIITITWLRQCLTLQGSAA